MVSASGVARVPGTFPVPAAYCVETFERGADAHIYIEECLVGCITRLGCLAVVGIAAVGAGAWWLNGGDLPLPGTAERREADRRADRALTWSSLNDASVSGSSTVTSLSRANGPAFVTLSPGDLAGFLAVGIARTLPRSAMDPQVAIEGNRLHLRALVNMRDLAGEGALGSTLGITLGRALNERDTLHIAGTMDVLRPGMAQYHIDKLAIRSVDIPPRLIPPLVRSLRSRLSLPDSLAGDALPIPMPPYVGDIRIANDRMTLYRTPR